MAEYKGIKGFKVQYLSADPSDPNIGQTWYNSTSKDLKFTEFATAAWTTANNLASARYGLSGAGIKTAALAFGGVPPLGGSSTGTEEYDGTNWTSGGSLPAAKNYAAGCGTQTAALSFGGETSPGAYTNTTEEYNGTSWTGGGSLATTRRLLSGVGTQTAGLAFGGELFPGPQTDSTEEYNGTSWAAGGPLPSARAEVGAAGIQTAALSVGADQPTQSDETLQYDGTSWTAGGNLPAATGRMLGFGIQTSAIAAMGTTGGPYLNTTQSYNGSTWTTLPATTNTARGYAGTGGTDNTSGIIMGGTGSPSAQTATEEFTGAGPLTKTITVS
jgi:hypothetical protein